MPILSFVKFVVLPTVFLGLVLSCVAQDRASTPIADPNDSRFVDVTEDFTSPEVTRSHLRPMPPLGGFIDDTHAGYTIQLLQLQWRWGDPIDVYVLKPKGVKNPPVILNL